MAQVNQRAQRGIGGDAADEDGGAGERGVGEKRRRDAAGEADEGTDGQIEIVARDDEHLRHRRQGDGHGKTEHQVEAEIADGAGIQPGDRRQHHRQRKGRQQGTHQARGVDRCRHQLAS